MTNAEMTRRLATLSLADLTWIREHIQGGCGASGIKAMTATITLAQINAVFRWVYLMNQAQEKFADLGKMGTAVVLQMLAGNKSPADIQRITGASAAHIKAVQEHVRLANLHQVARQDAVERAEADAVEAAEADAHRQGAVDALLSPAIQVGDTIRSYDFEPRQGRGACFVEGTVLRIDDARGVYLFTCTRDVFDGRAVTVNSRVGSVQATPMRLAITEFTGRIVRI